MKDYFSITNNKINEIYKVKTKISSSDNSVLDTIRLNYKFWNKKLFPVCKAFGIGKTEIVCEILEAVEFKDLNRSVINTYLNRVHKEFYKSSGRGNND